ncbi:MAG: NAD-dependent deacylase [Alphaproteobacteria bacterium]|nr:NAD-dependent deacylase [Alphaproteobacteria bacterium]
MKNVFILTGAGISAESGLKTFRDADGLWENFKVEDVASIEGFEKNPKLVHEFYNHLRPQMDKAEPNKAHIAISEFQKKNLDITVNVITQNVDLLHEKAGTKNVLHMHGRIDETVCLNCGHVVKTLKESQFDGVCEKCGAKNFLKPNIVFFGEMPMFMDEISDMLKKCDLFVAVGTSGVVYPAAGFVAQAKYYGAQTYLFNLEYTENNYYFDHQVMGKASETLPQFLEKLTF